MGDPDASDSSVNYRSRKQVTGHNPRRPHTQGEEEKHDTTTAGAGSGHIYHYCGRGRLLTMGLLPPAEVETLGTMPVYVYFQRHYQAPYYPDTPPCPSR